MEFIKGWSLPKGIWIVLLTTFFSAGPVIADDGDVVRALLMDPAKLAGIDLPAEEQFFAPEDVLEGEHKPRGEVLFYGDQLIIEVYEDEPLTFRINEPYTFDEFVYVLDGKLILTGPDGVSQEYVAGDSLVVPKGFVGTWQMLGNFRELVVIERSAYEAEFGAPE
jgi:uncharacterized cupin superfamily protein